MISSGPAPVITNRYTLPNRQPLGENIRLRQPAGRPMDSLHRTPTVQFGARQLKGPLFDHIVKQGYEPFVITRKKEIPKVVKLIKRSFGDLAGGTMTQPEYTQKLTELLQDKAYICVARDKKTQALAGTATLQSNGFIFAVGVDPKHRQQGIASTLMQELIEEAKRHGYPKVELESGNKDAIRIYRKLGFQTDTILENNWHCMSLNLAPNAQSKGLLGQVQSVVGWVWHQVKTLLSYLFSSTAPAIR